VAGGARLAETSSYALDAGTPGPVIEMRGLVKRYGAVTALDGVDLRVEAGTVHGLLGPNGAGKTTLLRVLLGLVRPDAGQVRLCGRSYADVGQQALDGVGGFVEAPTCWPYLTGRRTLDLLDRLDLGGAGRTAPVTPDEALAAVGLLPRAGERVGGWSLGMRQRLGLAAALLRAERLLVLDEPANGLDPLAVRDLHALLTRLAHLGTAVLLSSHDMGEVELLCRTVTVVRGGRVAFDGDLAALRARAPRPAARLHTSDDRAAAGVAATVPGVLVQGPVVQGPVPDGQGPVPDGLRLRADTDALDALVHALSRAGIAVRELRHERTPLADLVLALDEPPGQPSPDQS